MKIVTVHKAKTELSKLIAAAESGEEIVIARRDKPAVRLVPVEALAKAEVRAARKRAFGSLSHLRGSLPPDPFDQPMSEDELQAWEGKYSFDPGKPDR